MGVFTVYVVIVMCFPAVKEFHQACMDLQGLAVLFQFRM